MVLATHAVVGAAAANLFPSHPVAAFFVGFISHFFLDAIPHWHYKLRSHSYDQEHPLNSDIHLNEHFPLDLLKIGCDALLGVGVAVFFFPPTSPLFLSATLLGAVGGILPDGLQFVYFKWRHEPLISLQRFHIWVHSNIDVDRYRIAGPAAQVAFGLVCIAIVRSLTST